jgi:hypothetical protein
MLSSDASWQAGGSATPKLEVPDASADVRPHPEGALTLSPEVERERAWSEVCDRVVTFSLGNNQFSDFRNVSATIDEIATELQKHDVRPVELPEGAGPEEVKAKRDRLKARRAMSGAVLRDDTPVRYRPAAGGLIHVPVELKDGEPKKNFRNDNVACVALICFDLDNKDGQRTIDDAEGWCLERGLACSVYSTFNHSEKQEKARLVIYLASPVDTSTPELREEYSAFYDLLGQDACGGRHDPTCRNPARVIYLPANDGVSPKFARFHKGRLFDPTPYLVAARAKISEDRRAREEGRAQRARRELVLYRKGTTSEKTAYGTPGLAKFLARCGQRFDAAAFLRAYHRETCSERGGGVAAHCPFGAEHASEVDKADDLWGMAAADCQHGVFVLECCHSTCKDRHGGHFLDEICQQFGLTVDDLIGFVDLTEDEKATIAARKQAATEDNEQSAGARAAWSELEAIAQDAAALQAVLNGEDVERAFRVLATVKAGSYEPRRNRSEPPRVLSPSRARHVKGLAKRLGMTESCLTFKIDGLHQEYRKATTEEKVEDDGAEALDSLAVEAEPTFANDFERLEHTRERIEQGNSPPTLFKRDSVVVRIITDGDGAKVEELIRPAWINELVRRCGDLPFRDDVAYFMGVPDWRFPQLKGLAHVPVFSRSGFLRTAPGYDPESRTYLLPGFDMLPPPTTVSQLDVEKAKALLLDPLCDFPLTDDFAGGDTRPIYQGDPANHIPNLERGPSSRAHVLALALQPFVRAMIDGPCPAYHIDKADNGEGGTLLTHHAAIIFTGGPLPVTPLASESVEKQKALLAMLRTGPPFIMFDNAAGTVDSGDLAASITECKYQGRVLGRSEIVQCDVVGSFVFNGVGLRFSRELARRMVPIRLETGHPDPSMRSGFKYNLDQHLRAHRRELVWAAWVLITNWVQRGCPPPTWRDGARPLGSFEAWSHVLGGILEAAGVPGFLGNVTVYRESMREERGSELAAAEELARTFPDKPFSAADVLLCLSDSDVLPKLDGRPGAAQANKSLLSTYIKDNLRRTWELRDPRAIRAILRLGPTADYPATLQVALVRTAERPAKWLFRVTQ